MSEFGVIDEILEVTGADESFTNITIGEVVDTNDPQQMGRVRAVCPAMGDTRQQALKHIPWAMYGSPFGGVNEVTARGRGNDKSEGPVSYGMWAIPKIGSQVLIMCIDGNPAHRVWLGCLPGQFFPHTMPHGRYSAKPSAGNPEGPLTSTENPIEPLHGNLSEAFSGGSAAARESFEFRSRGADNQVAHLTPEEIAARVKFSKLADDRDEIISEADGESLNHSQGYSRSNIAPNKTFSNTGGVNYDSHIYAWTTPGFHALHMDDRAESCRMRFRTTAGHQIILDDTNERVYISTAQGKTWIEIDEKGTIDIYGEQDISIRSDQDVNISAGKSIRMKANDGIHMIAGDEIRLHAKAEGNDLNGDLGLHFKSEEDIHIESVGTFDLLTGGLTRIQIGSTLELTSGNTEIQTGTLDITSGNTNISTSTLSVASSAFQLDTASAIINSSTFDVDGGTAITMTAGVIDLNGPPAASTSISSPPAPANAVIALESFEISREPAHEPWARVYTTIAGADNDLGNSPTLEFSYTDAGVDRSTARPDRPKDRNLRWHR